MAFSALLSVVLAGLLLSSEALTDTNRLRTTAIHLDPITPANSGVFDAHIDALQVRFIFSVHLDRVIHFLYVGM